MNLELDSLPGAGNSDGLLEQLRAGIHASPDNLAEPIDAICREADRLSQADDQTAAEQLYRNTLSICEVSPVLVGAPIGFRIYRRLADLLKSRDRPDEACLSYLTALTLAASANPADIDVVSAAETHMHLGVLFATSDELTKAAKHYRQGIELLTQKVPENAEPEPSPAELLAELEENLGDLQVLLGDHSSALGGFSRALQYRRRLLNKTADQNTLEVQQLFEKLGSVFKKLGEVDTSRACLECSQNTLPSPKSL